MGMIKSKIINEKGLLLQEYSGELTKNELTQYFTGLYDNPEYLDVSIIFSDFTNAIITFSVDDIVEVANFILTHAPKVHYVSNSILVCEPLVTAYSILYKEIMDKMSLYECKIFSTFEEASKFINYDISELKTLIKTSLIN